MRVLPSAVVHFIDVAFPFTAQIKGTADIGQNQFRDVSGISAMLDSIPPELLILEPTDYAHYVASTAVIKGVITSWQIPSHYGAYQPLSPMQGLDGRHPLTVIRHCLAKCPDAAPAKGTSELGFISDPALREDLRLDMSHATASLARSDWKGATVMAGSVVEALLLWALQAKYTAAQVATAKATLESKNSISKGLGAALDGKEWHLHQYIELASELGAIRDETAIQSRQARGFRNLIHPGATQRLEQRCDRGTALAALSAVELAVRDLS